VKITNTDYSGIETGSPFTITWTNASAPVTILLKMGNSTNVNDLKAVAIWVDLLGTSFDWTPAPMLETGPYRFELADSAVAPDYSPQFMLTHVGGSAVSSSLTTPLPTPTNTFLTSTTASSTAQSTSAPPSSTSAPISAASSTATDVTQSTGEASRHRKPAIIAGIVIGLSLLIVLTSYFAICLLRDRCHRKKLPAQSSDKSKPTDGDASKGIDIESGTKGGRVEMSGALDSVSSVAISSRRPSTRPGTGEEIAEPEQKQEPESEPVEIGSSGYGKEMSEVEKGKAVELEPNQRVRFEERKRRRRGVKLAVGRLRILL